MATSCRYLILALWLSFMLVSALLLFSRGFLLTRNVLERKACCIADDIKLDTVTKHGDYVDRGRWATSDVDRRADDRLYSNAGARGDRYRNSRDEDHYRNSNDVARNRMNDGDRYRNSNEGDRYRNSIDGERYRNSNEDHYRNTNEGDHYRNSIEGDRYRNSIEGDRYRNSIEDRYRNSDEGDRYRNSNEGDRYRNSNEGDRYRNSNEGDRYRNSNERDRHHNSNDGDRHRNSNGCAQNACLGTTAVRAVVLIVDALRYDFAARQNVDEPLAYHNHLTIVDDLVRDGGRLYKFLADPPTTTFQRINALTTGSLPTFVDAGANFASTEIHEDNIVDQLVGRNRTVVFMGDDTWANIYPKRFKRFYPYPSFNVWDLDTVDRGVKAHLVPEMRRDDWDVIVAHTLGVDHCGHRYGARHPEMARKLKETNALIEDVVAALDDVTVLFVMGDHGMTESGDHGGETEKEVSAALLVYTRNRDVSSLLTTKSSVHQVDFAPTFAQIMGVPIPFSSIGTTLLTNVPADVDDLASARALTSLIVWTNVEQVTTYIKEYARRHSQFPTSVVARLLSDYDALLLQKSASHFTSYISDAIRYVNDVRDICRAVWVQFDSQSMSRGLVLILLGIALGFIVVDGVPSEILRDMIQGRFLVYGLLFVAGSMAFCCLLRFFNVILRLELALYVAASCSSIVALSCLIVFNWYSVAEHWYKVNSAHDPLSLLTRVVALASAVAMFSNSYVVQESAMVPYFLTSLVWVSVVDFKLEAVKKFLVEKCSNQNIFGFVLSSVKCKLIVLALCLNVILRLTFYFWECREEQNAECRRSKNVSKTLSCVVTVVTFATFVTLVRLLLRHLGNLTGWRAPVFVARYFPTVNVVCCGCYWILDSLPTVTRPKLLFLSWQVQLLPATVFVISGSAVILLFASPLCVHRTYNRVLYHHPDDLIPSIFNKMRNIMSDRKSEEDRTPVVYGLATVYSATFINLAVFLSFLSAVLLGESRAVVNVAMIACLFLLAIILAIVKFEKSKNNRNNCFSVPWWSIICWSLSSTHFFYTTGHQPTFATVQWDCAGLFGNIVSTVVPGALILMNTFISQIVHSLLLPLLMIVPFTVATVWPSVVSNHDLFRSGELELFQNRELRRQELFSLVARYILFSAFKVFVAMFSCSVHSRHLMVWAIFAPKFIFESVAFLVSLPFLILGFLFVERISTKIGSLVTDSSHDD